MLSTSYIFLFPENKRSISEYVKLDASQFTLGIPKVDL